MQSCRLILQRTVSRPSFCSTWSLSSLRNSRFFTACHAGKKQSSNIELPEDSKSNRFKLPRDFKSDESEPPRNLEPPKDLDAMAPRKRDRKEYLRKYFRERYASDPIFREKALEKTRSYGKARYACDREFRAHTNELALNHHYTSMEQDAFFAVRKVLLRWVYEMPGTRDLLCWKTHVPVLTPEKLERRCASCGIKRHGGMKLYWQRRQGHEEEDPLYDCISCFFKDPSAAMPQGFEDVKTKEQLYQRREELLGIKYRPCNRRSSASPPLST